MVEQCVHEIIRSVRQKAKLTQTEVSKKLRIAQTTIVKYENGKLKISLRYLAGLSELSKVPLTQLALKKGGGLKNGVSEREKYYLTAKLLKPEIDFGRAYELINKACDKFSAITDHGEQQKNLKFLFDLFLDHYKYNINLDLDNFLEIMEKYTENH